MNKIKDLIVELGGFWEHQNNIMRVRVFEMLKLDTIRKKKKKKKMNNNNNNSNNNNNNNANPNHERIGIKAEYN